MITTVATYLSEKNIFQLPSTYKYKGDSQVTLLILPQNKQKKVSRIDKLVGILKNKEKKSSDSYAEYLLKKYE